MLYLFGAKIRLFLVTSKDLGKNVGMMIKKIGGSRYVREPPGFYSFLISSILNPVACAMISGATF